MPRRQKPQFVNCFDCGGRVAVRFAITDSNGDVTCRGCRRERERNEYASFNCQSMRRLCAEDSQAFAFAVWLIRRQWPCMRQHFYKGAEDIGLMRGSLRHVRRELITDVIEYAKSVRLRGGDFEQERIDLDAPIRGIVTADVSIARLVIDAADSFQRGDCTI